MKIFVQTLTGQKIPFNVDATDSVLLLQQLILRKESVPLDQQRLICNGIHLQQQRAGTAGGEEYLLGDFGIQEGSIVHLVLRLRGNGIGSIAEVPEDRLLATEIKPTHASTQMFVNTDTFEDELGIVPFVPFEGESEVVSFSRPLRTRLTVRGSHRLIVEDPRTTLHLVLRCISNDCVVHTIRDVPAMPSNIDQYYETVTTICANTLQLPRQAIDGIEVLRASGAWKRLLTDDDLFHMANTNKISLVMKRRVVEVGDRSTADVWTSPYAEPTADQLLLFNGPEHATDKFKGIYSVPAAQFKEVLADGIVVTPATVANAAELTERSMPLKHLQIPKLPAVSPLGLRGVQHPDGIPDSDKLSFFKKHGWMTVPFDDRSDIVVNSFVKNFFEDVPLSVKRGNAMDPDDRTYGWHHMTHQGKEILKVRDVPTLKDNWRPGRKIEVTELDSLTEAYHTMNNLATPIARQIFTEVLGLDGKLFDATFPAAGKPTDATPVNEKFSNFFEAFRYSGNPLGVVHNKQDQGPNAIDGFIPCAAHCDIGFITMTTKSSIGHGLQLKHEGEWIDAEALLDGGTALVFAGEMLDYVSRGQVPMVEHRVVMGAGSPPRYTSIHEVIPLPSAVVPRVGVAEEGDQALTGAEVFVLRSMGRSSVNWEA